ncbi:MAG: hypothetical protein GY716_08795 [bacterium]|nr:hypothetical protein [bacterium]
MPRLLLLVGVLALVAAPPAAAAEPQSFVFFNVDRERIREKSFLDSPALVGAQLKYRWSELEPERDRYRVDLILDDLRFLQEHGKKLFIQLQEVSFDEKIVNVPDYLRQDPAFGGGAHLAYDVDQDGNVSVEGWVPRRWDPDVQARFRKLLRVLADVLDGKIEGLNLPETSIGFGAPRFYPDDFTNDGYVEAVRTIMSDARESFRESCVIQYANFMPGEWLPWEDGGYLKQVYAHANEIGVGVGGPDLLPYRKGQQNHSHPLIRARDSKTVAGVAVQWGNFDDISPRTGKRTTVEELYAFAGDDLRLDYVFWGTQEPYYSKEVLPYLNRRAGLGDATAPLSVPSAIVP